MRQLPLAALNFESAIGLLPTGHELISGTGNPNDPFSNDPTSNGWGWRTKILPYMDQGNLNTLFDLTLPIADPVNRELAETVIPNFSCPSDPTINDSLYFVSGSLSMSLSNYLGNGGSFEWREFCGSGSNSQRWNIVAHNECKPSRYSSFSY